MDLPDQLAVRVVESERRGCADHGVGVRLGRLLAGRLQLEVERLELRDGLVAAETAQLQAIGDEDLALQ